MVLATRLERDGRRLRRTGAAGIALSLAFAALLLRPLAAATPPDATWNPGIYDDADFDDVVTQIALLSAACDVAGPLEVAPDVRVESLTTISLRPIAFERQARLQDRAPPLL